MKEGPCSGSAFSCRWQYLHKNSLTRWWYPRSYFHNYLGCWSNPASFFICLEPIWPSNMIIYGADCHILEGFQHPISGLFRSSLLFTNTSWKLPPFMRVSFVFPVLVEKNTSDKLLYLLSLSSREVVGGSQGHGQICSKMFDTSESGQGASCVPWQKNMSNTSYRKSHQWKPQVQLELREMFFLWKCLVKFEESPGQWWIYLLNMKLFRK